MESRFARSLHRTLPPLLLLGTLALTRSGHFGSAASLPDATLGVLFLLGATVPSASGLAAALALSVLVDALVIKSGGSSYCVTPAYAALLLAYAVMWLGGRAIRKSLPGHLAGRLALAVPAAAVTAALSYAISSGSFYLWSGYFADLEAVRYVEAVRGYAVASVGWACAYVAAGFAVSALAARLPLTRPAPTA